MMWTMTWMFILWMYPTSRDVERVQLEDEITNASSLCIVLNNSKQVATHVEGDEDGVVNTLCVDQDMSCPYVTLSQPTKLGQHLLPKLCIALCFHSPIVVAMLRNYSLIPVFDLSTNEFCIHRALDIHRGQMVVILSSVRVLEAKMFRVHI